MSVFGNVGTQLSPNMDQADRYDPNWAFKSGLKWTCHSECSECSRWSQMPLNDRNLSDEKDIPLTFFLAFATIQKSTSLFQSKFGQKAQKSTKKYKKSTKFWDVS